MRLLSPALPDREALVAFAVAEDDRERDLLELGGANPLADRLGRLADVDAVARGAEALDDRGRGLEMALADRQHPHLHRREPERERTADVLDEDADEPLERSVESPVDDEHRM